MYDWQMMSTVLIETTQMDEFEDKIKAVFEVHAADITNQLWNDESSKMIEYND